MKKALALLLVLVLALGMSTVAFAAKVDKDQSKQPGGGDTAGQGWAGTLTGNEYGLGEFGPNGSNNKITIPLAQDNFTVDDDYADFVTTNVATYGTTKTVTLNGASYTVANAGDRRLTSGDIGSSKMSVKFKASKGSQVIDEIALSRKDAEVTIEFIEPFKSNNTDGVDFEFKVYLVVDGKNWTDSGVTFSGTYKNEVDDDYDADTDWYDFSDGNILKPSEFIRVFDGDMGEGVIVNMRGLKNAKYWGVANQDLTDADQDLMIKQPEITQVFHLPNIGIANVANFVTLEDADPTAYVYDGDLNYLGRGNANLPFSETYYLASSELDTDDADAPDDLDDGDYDDGDELDDGDYMPGGDNSEGGGDDLYPDNINDNPGTGK